MGGSRRGGRGILQTGGAHRRGECRGDGGGQLDIVGGLLIAGALAAWVIEQVETRHRRLGDVGLELGCCEDARSGAGLPSRNELVDHTFGLTEHLKNGGVIDVRTRGGIGARDGTARTELSVLTLLPASASSMTVMKRTPDTVSSFTSSAHRGASSLSRAPLKSANSGSQYAASPFPPTGRAPSSR
jgi:hypothetical protein